MGAYWFKQPNGLYGRFSTIVDCPTHYNYTKEEMIIELKNKGWSDLEIEQLFDDKFPTNWIHNMEDVKRDYCDNNMPEEEFNEWLKKVEILEEEQQ